MKIGAFFVTDFEPIEAVTTIDILNRCDIDVVTISLTNSKIVQGSHGITMKCDEIFDYEKAQKLDGIFASGGTGVKNYFGANSFLDLVVDFNSKGKLLAFICGAPRVLSSLGILKNKEFTAYPTFVNEIIEQGGIYVNENAVKCDNIITGKSVGSAVDFSKLLAKSMTNEIDVDTILKSMH